jgi:peptidoglycan hydrolase-like protein with peptidoglycan-binding domain
MKAEEILAIPSGAGADYKNTDRISNPPEWRHRIDAAKTLIQCDEVFRRGDAFASASEICEYFLVPADQSEINGKRGPEIQAAMKEFWKAHNLTGDNTLERPYANLFSKLTTRSNVYRVHVRAQVLRKARSSPPGGFDPERDAVLGEYRGEAVVERYLLPNRPGTGGANARYPDYATDPAAMPLDSFHQIRVLEMRRFSL